MVDKNGFTMTWVVKDDVIDMVEAESVTTLRHLPSDVAKAEVERRAQRIWDNPVHKVCFPLDIYRTAQGKEGTQAEFMCEWLKSGYSWEESKTHLKALSLSKGAKRALPETFREDAMKRLRDDAAKTYAPQGAR